jgi:hypothetical protein
MRWIAALAAVASFVLVGFPVAAADQPPVAPSTQPSGQPSATLSDQEIRDLLVGNKYTIGWRQGMRLTIEVHADGKLHGFINDEGVVPHGIASARNQDDGTYSIGDGKYCTHFAGAWANGNGKPNCYVVTRRDGRYYLDAFLIRVIPAPK